MKHIMKPITLALGLLAMNVHASNIVEVDTMEMNVNVPNGYILNNCNAYPFLPQCLACETAVDQPIGAGTELIPDFGYNCRANIANIEVETMPAPTKSCKHKHHMKN